MKLRFAITKRQLYVETLLRVKFHNFIQCYLEINLSYPKGSLCVLQTVENNNKLTKLFTTKVTKVKRSNAFHLSFVNLCSSYIILVISFDNQVY
jgi:hypothetical protein